MMLGLGFRWWLAISTWLIASLWITGKKSFAFINGTNAKRLDQLNTLGSVSDYGT